MAHLRMASTSTICKNRCKAGVSSASAWLLEGEQLKEVVVRHASILGAGDVRAFSGYALTAEDEIP